jgi:hypothetical protein
LVELPQWKTRKKGFNCPYKMMNQLLKTIDITHNHVIRITYSRSRIYTL